VLFAIPPILTNGYVGMREVDRDVVEAARGVGLSPLQVVRRVELPLAVPLLLNGIRLAAVQVIATATIAALVAGGGLGNIILRGFGTQDQAAVVSGALLVAGFAVATELLFTGLSRVLDPVARQQREIVLDP
jgi:osmoprotectant transport system permease protein